VTSRELSHEIFHFQTQSAVISRNSALFLCLSIVMRYHWEVTIEYSIGFANVNGKNSTFGPSREVLEQ
jgi:hypothetical protein